MRERWQLFRQQVLRRRVPHTLLSWRFLLPGQSPAIRLHRRVFLAAWPRRPRWQRALIIFYSALSWWFLFAWIAIFASQRRSRREARGQIGRSLPQQLFDLLSLALLHGIPPSFYYQYSLYRQPRRRWLNYIYTHELPHWHQAFLRNVGAESLRLITHKRDFASVLAARGIATVETCACFPKGAPIDAEQLFLQRSLLLKPESGSRAEGHLRLEFDTVSGDYRLTAGEEAFESETEIVTAVAARVQSRDYMVQPLLENGAEMAGLCGMKRLATLRLITGLVGGEPVALFANLEVPAEEGEGFRMVALDLETGRLFYGSESRGEGMRDLLEQVDGKALPGWREAVALCTRAHTYFPDLPTVGWDVVFTDDGVQLLEGNINWGVVAHQVTTGKPLLESTLVQVYQKAENR